MTTAFYLYGIIEIILSSLMLIRSMHDDIEMIDVSEIDVEEKKLILKKQKTTWWFPFIVIYIVWYIIGLIFMPEKFLFSLLAIISIVIPCSLLLIDFPVKVFKFNVLIKILIIAIIVYNHFYPK
jgi:hypothetical protein